LKFELIAIPVALLLCLALPRLRWLRGLRRRGGRLAARRGWSLAVVGGSGLLTCLVYAAFAGVPVPQFHDEFAYLLAADTYAHGRLTNPPHPLWIHFESFHILQQPTYMAKFPPAQGLFLALGQVLSGYPIAGVWLSWGLACAATCWMLQAWLPPRWALLGGLLTVLHPGMFLQWGNSYWGGAVPILGGALLFGALRRLLIGPSFGLSFVLAAGLALLALSRPLEGLLASLPPALILLVGLAQRRKQFEHVVLRVAAPVTLVLLAALGFQAYANFKVTGEPLRLPYAVYQDTYAVAPLVIWGQPRPVPAYHHPVMGSFYTGWELQCYTDHWPNPWPALYQKVLWLWRFYLQGVLGVPLVTLPWLLRNRWVRFALADMALVLAGMFQISFLFPHYAAPIACLVVFVVVQALRQVRVGGRRRRSLGAVAPLLLVVWFISAGITVAEKWPKPDQWNRQRAAIQARLEATAEQHLVIVRYSDHHLTYQEWVYNRADIDKAPVVWARDMGDAGNSDLLAYFRDRRVWLLQANGESELKPYPTAGRPAEDPRHGPEP
jgi:hypothetical protein